MLGQVGFQPASTLGVSDCVGGHRGDIGECLAWLHGQDKAHGHHVFADNPELRRHGECILGGADAPSMLFSIAIMA